MIGHIGGVPVEEVLQPLVAGGTWRFSWSAMLPRTPASAEPVGKPISDSGSGNAYDTICSVTSPRPCLST